MSQQLILQYLQAILKIKPEIVNAINDYEFLDLVKSVSNLVNDKLIKSKYQYEELLKAIEDAKAQQAEQQALIMQAQMMKDGATANKQNADALATQKSAGI